MEGEAPHYDHRHAADGIRILYDGAQGALDPLRYSRRRVDVSYFVLHFWREDDTGSKKRALINVIMCVNCFS